MLTAPLYNWQAVSPTVCRDIITAFELCIATRKKASVLPVPVGTDLSADKSSLPECADLPLVEVWTCVKMALQMDWKRNRWIYLDCVRADDSRTASKSLIRDDTLDIHTEAGRQRDIDT